MTELRALTVQQPWAWAIIHGGKDVENRTQEWSYRGPLAIHAGLRIDRTGVARVAELSDPPLFPWPSDVNPTAVFGAFIGVVDLVDVHQAAGLPDDPWGWCCRPWGEGPGVLLKADGKFTGPKTHLAVANPRPIADPVPCRGRLGLWTPPPDVLAEVREAIA